VIEEHRYSSDEADEQGVDAPHVLEGKPLIEVVQGEVVRIDQRLHEERRVEVPLPDGTGTIVLVAPEARRRDAYVVIDDVQVVAADETEQVEMVTVETCNHILVNGRIHTIFCPDCGREITPLDRLDFDDQVFVAACPKCRAWVDLETKHPIADRWFT